MCSGIWLPDPFAYQNKRLSDTLPDREPLMAVHAGPARCCVLSEMKRLNFIRSLRSQKIKTLTPNVNVSRRKNNEPTTSGRSVTERMVVGEIPRRRCIASFSVPMIKVPTNKAGNQTFWRIQFLDLQGIRIGSTGTPCPDMVCLRFATHPLEINRGFKSGANRVLKPYRFINNCPTVPPAFVC
jgi:hypothetical protein